MSVFFRSFALSSQNFKKVGDVYNKLWASATGGMRPGRRQKKITIFPVNKQLLGFGRKNEIHYGLNKKIGTVTKNDDFNDETKIFQYSSLKLLKPWKSLNVDKKIDEKLEKSSKESISKSRKFRASLAVKGWSGSSFCGRYAGTPISSSDGQYLNFESIVIDLRRIKVMKSSGKTRVFRAAVVVGNRNGLVGWSDAISNSGIAAIRKARNKAANYLHSVPICDNHTIFHDALIKFNRTELSFEKKPMKYGLKCQRVIKAICQMAGIQDIRVSLRGNNNPITLCKATIEGLAKQETHEDLAERTGLFVVESRAELGGNNYELPKVVAIPSLDSIQKKIRAMKMDSKFLDTEEYNNSLDPHKGLHRLKDLSFFKQYKS